MNRRKTSGNPPRPFRRLRMAEHGSPDLIRVGPPFIQVLVQKSVATITKLAGRPSPRMLSDSRAAMQGVAGKKLVLRLQLGKKALGFSPQAHSRRPSVRRQALSAREPQASHSEENAREEPAAC